jgi:hypothetical protein
MSTTLIMQDLDFAVAPDEDPRAAAVARVTGQGSSPVPSPRSEGAVAAAGLVTQASCPG